MAVALALAVLPGLVLLGLFWFLDRYEREPLGHTLLAVGLGLAALYPTVLLSRWLQSLFGAEALALAGVTGDLERTFFVFAASEEFVKWVVMVTSVLWWAEFDEPYDGILYGAALALGLAVPENVFYVLRAGGPDRALELALWRGVLAVPAHAVYGVAMGASLGRAKFAETRASAGLFVWASLVVPWLFHGTYDFLCYYLHRSWGWWALGALSLVMWSAVLAYVVSALARSPFKDAGVGGPDHSNTHATRM